MIRLLILAVILPALSASLSADPRPLRIGIDRSAAPMEFERDGAPAGFNVDMIRAMARRAGIEVEFQFLEWTNVLESIKSEKLDIMFAMKTPEREKTYRFGRPFLDISVRIFVSEDVFGISGLADLEGRSVAVIRGFACHDALLESGLSYRIVPVEDVPQALDLLANGDVFAFVGQYHLAKYALQQKARPVKIIGDAVQTTPFCLASHAGAAPLINRLDKALASMQQDGEYARIYERWYGSASLDQGSWSQNALLTLGIFLSVVALLVAWSLTLRQQIRHRTRELYTNLEKFRKFTDRAPFPVAIVNGEQIEYLNPQFSKTFGYSLDDIPDCNTWFTTVYPDSHYRSSVMTEWSKYVSEKIDIHENPKVFDLVTRSGQKVTAEFRMLHLDDGRIIMIIEDVTLQRRLEEERLRQQQIESISLLAGGIAHDFNNILMHLIGHINLMQMGDGLTPDQEESLTAMERSILRARGITGQLLTFSRGGAPVKKIQSIAPLIRESVDFVLHGSNCTADIAIQPDLPELDIDGGQISQTINNLVINAAQAMPQGGIIHLKAHALSRSEAAITREDAQAGLWVCLEIRDHGPGIPSEAQSHIFTPYFTSKEHGRGRGLTTAWSIVNKHGGELRFSSSPGQGTTFSILLPVPPGQKRDQQAANMPPTHARFRGSVIIMDDEQPIITILSRMLERLGLKVTATTNGADLIREFMRARDAGSPYDLVITDLTVPGGMGGRDAIAILRKAAPGVRAIVSSGFSSDPVLADCTAWGFAAALLKPYTYAQLEQILSAVLPESSCT